MKVSLLHVLLIDCFQLLCSINLFRVMLLFGTLCWSFLYWFIIVNCKDSNIMEIISLAKQFAFVQEDGKSFYTCYVPPCAQVSTSVRSHCVFTQWNAFFFRACEFTFCNRRWVFWILRQFNFQFKLFFEIVLKSDHEQCFIVNCEVQFKGEFIVGTNHIFQFSVWNDCF